MELLERLAASRDDFFELDLLEECLSLPARWTSLPKVTPMQSEQVVRTAATKARELADWLDTNREQLRGRRRYEAPEQGIAGMAAELRRFSQAIITETRFEGDPELAQRPTHPMAFRNFVVEQLLLLFENAGAPCTRLDIVQLTTAITGSNDNMDESTVRKAHNRLKIRN